MNDSLDWDEIIADLGPALYRFFLVSFDSVRADDLVQETIIRLLDKVRAKKFDPNRGHLRMYAFGIAHFVRIESRRISQHHEYQDIAMSDVPLPDEALDRERTYGRLRSAIANLSEVQQQVLSFYLDGELSLQQIGVILEIPAATVRSHLHRAKEALKTELISVQTER